MADRPGAPGRRRACWLVLGSWFVLQRVYSAGYAAVRSGTAGPARPRSP